MSGTRRQGEAETFPRARLLALYVPEVPAGAVFGTLERRGFLQLPYHNELGGSSPVPPPGDVPSAFSLRLWPSAPKDRLAAAPDALSQAPSLFSGCRYPRPNLPRSLGLSRALWCRQNGRQDRHRVFLTADEERTGSKCSFLPSGRW